MNWIEIIKLSFNQLIIHKLRSFLTLLGVIFGIAAVISMLSIGEGAREEMLQQIRLLGLNNIIIRAVELTETQKEEVKLTYSLGLRFQDSKKLKNTCRFIKMISPMKQVKKDITYPARKLNLRIIGITPSYFHILNLGLKQGRLLTDIDLGKYKQVCVVGAGIKKELFGLESCLGKKIVFSNLPFEVVGELADRSVPKAKSGKTNGSAIQIHDTNMDIYVPITTVMTKTTSIADADKINKILVNINNEQNVVPASEMIKNILNKAHRNVKDYKLVVPQELLRQSQETQKIFNIVMGCIAAISLLVGGIGIMNIMLATVTERTREIGIRRAVGATKAEIVKQFLVETATLSGMGGILGIVLGVSLTRVITFYSDWQTIVSVRVVLVAFIVSVSIGIIFGLYPAWKAAELDPVSALRYE